MPVELRQRLLESSRCSNRSLNAEIVDRLERSYKPSLAGRAAAALRTVPKSRGESLMRARRLRPIVAALAVLVIACIAAVVSASRGTTTSAQQSAILTAGEGPPALSKYLATAPGVEMNEGPAFAGDAAFEERAYPDTTISVADMEAARAAFSEFDNRHSKKSKEAKGSGA